MLSKTPSIFHYSLLDFSLLTLIIIVFFLAPFNISYQVLSFYSDTDTNLVGVGHTFFFFSFFCFLFSFLAFLKNSSNSVNLEPNPDKPHFLKTTSIMIYPLVSSENQSWRTLITPQILKNHKIQPSSLNLMMKRPIFCFHSQNPETQIKNPPKGATLVTTPTQVLQRKTGEKKRRDFEGIKRDNNESQSLVGSREMLVLCGFGYWVQGFRCFPWLALNFHMTHSLNLSPSILQLVQNSGNLPMVAKPLYGILSDAFSINGARRIPYISIGGWVSNLS